MVWGRKLVLSGVLLVPLGIAALLVFDSGIFFIRGEKVSFQNGDVTLVGTLAYPRWGDGPWPAAVIVHGSGATSRGDLKGYARRLVPKGLAVLMYDKRGVGESTGRYSQIPVAESEQRLGELAGDARAAVDFLAGRPDIDPKRIGLLGGSQAGWIMPLAAARNERVSFVVSVSGPAVTYGQEIYFSQLTGDDPGPYGNLTDEEIAQRLEAFEGPHGFDPRPVLQALEAPSLWLLGGKDRSVPTDLSLRNLERLRQTGSTNLDIELFPEGDHSLRHAESEKRINYWPKIIEWLKARGILAP